MTRKSKREIERALESLEITHPDVETVYSALVKAASTESPKDHAQASAILDRAPDDLLLTLVGPDEPPTETEGDR